MDDIERRVVREEIAAREKKFMEDFISAEFAELVGDETQKLLEAAGILAEQTTYSLEEIIGALMNALNGDVNPKRVRRAFSDLKTAWDRKETREKLRSVERKTACRFRQHKARESERTVRKKTGSRRREWRGPWKER